VYPELSVAAAAATTGAVGAVVLTVLVKVVAVPVVLKVGPKQEVADQIFLGGVRLRRRTGNDMA